jgi:hypothetical protein
MSIKVVYSELISPQDAVMDLYRQLGHMNSKCIIYFASSKYDPSQLNRSMHNQFSGVTIAGCTTAGEIISGKVLNNSIVAMSFDQLTIEDCAVGIVENIREQNNVSKVLNQIGQHFKTPISELDINKYVGIILIDGLSVAEEKIMDTIGNNTDLLFVGGAAGDDLEFKKTFVSANGKTSSDAAVIMVLKVKNGFDTLKTQSFVPMKKILSATKVDESKRTVIEFNGKPAAVAYGEALNVPVEEVTNYFMQHPLGLLIGSEPFIRSPQQIKDNSMVFYCNIKNGMDLNVMESRDIIEDTKKALDEKIKEMGSISAILNFNCILRTLELINKKQTDAYGKLFTDIPTIGFSTYGEEFIGHINQTATMVLFK